MSTNNEYLQGLKLKIIAHVEAHNADEDEDKEQETFYDICHYVGIDPVEAQSGRIELLFGAGWVASGVCIDGLKIILE